MNPRLTPVIHTLFSKYEHCSQLFDFKGIARLFASKLIVAGPAGIVFHNNNFITRWRLDKSMKTLYGEAGLSSLYMQSISEEVISDQYSLVRVSWAVKFSKTLDQSLVFNISYIVRKKKRNAEIILFIAHEDEKKILEGYGLIK
jgi:hypothetical protein